MKLQQRQAKSFISGTEASQLATKALKFTVSLQQKQAFLTGRCYTVAVDLSDTVHDVKSKITDLSGIPPDLQHLMFVGNKLEGGRTLLDYGVKDKDCLYLTLGNRSWGCLVDVSKNRTVQALAGPVEVPRWRICTPGLNVEGRCANESCPASGQIVIDCKGMVSWSFIAGQAHCPVCKQHFQPITCGFVDCVWAFDGRKAGSGDGAEYVEGSWHRADDKQYHHFQKHNNQASWQMLVLSAKSARQLRPEATICPICWLGCRHTNDTTSCDHGFHPACLALWKEAQPNGSPLCRMSL
ncbi:hypothetical protein ABBQ38_15539 [Trebouxia sp. C0009 RCD-2024]